jgi:four helix bundle protein
MASMESSGESGFRTFEDLEVYKHAREFRKELYAVSRQLPAEERFALCDQIRRAAVSLTNNIAEGHGRYHFQEQIRFLMIARGSLEELIDDLNTCLDESYLPAEEVERLRALGWRVHRILAGYLRHLRQRRDEDLAGLKEPSTSYRTRIDLVPQAEVPPFED